MLAIPMDKLERTAIELRMRAIRTANEVDVSPVGG